MVILQDCYWRLLPPAASSHADGRLLVGRRDVAAGDAITAFGITAGRCNSMPLYWWHFLPARAPALQTAHITYAVGGHFCRWNAHETATRLRAACLIVAPLTLHAYVARVRACVCRNGPLFRHRYGAALLSARRGPWRRLLQHLPYLTFASLVTLVADAFFQRHPRAFVLLPASIDMQAWTVPRRWRRRRSGDGAGLTCRAAEHGAGETLFWV